MNKRAFPILIILFVLSFSLNAFAVDPLAQEYFNKASIQYLLGNYSQALKDLNDCLKIEPNHRSALSLIRSIEKEQKTIPFPLSLSEIKKEALIKEYLEKGKNKYAESDFQSASSYFRGALSLDHNNVNASFYLKQSQQMEEQARKENFRYLVLAILFFVIGVVLLAFITSYMLIWTYKDIIQSSIKKRKNRCFNCGAKTTSNIDLCPNCGAFIGAKMRKTISHEQAKWYAKWGWKKNPFTLDIHPELFTGYRNEVKTILEKINARSGHVLITGPLGVGKTTLLRWLTGHLANDFLAVYVSRPPQDFNQLIKLIIQRMNINVKHLPEYDVYHLDQLRRKAGKNLVILLDEAHEFSIEIERPLRTLGDLDGVKLVMAGLPETVDKFKNEIRPLYERLVLSISLRRLEKEDLKELIKARIENAGGEGLHPFSPDALDKIFELSQGIPRVAVKICDWAITAAIDAGEDKISVQLLTGWLAAGERTSS